MYYLVESLEKSGSLKLNVFLGVLCLVILSRYCSPLSFYFKYSASISAIRLSAGTKDLTKVISWLKKSLSRKTDKILTLTSWEDGIRGPMNEPTYGWVLLYGGWLRIVSRIQFNRLFWKISLCSLGCSLATLRSFLKML